MCLETRYDKKCRKRVGWKILREIDGNYYTGICNAVGRRITSEYTTDPYNGEITSNGYRFTYPAGFHIFATKEGAEKVRLSLRSGHGLAVKKVQFRKVVAYGQVKWWLPMHRGDTRTDTIVAREIRLKEE